MRMNNIVKIERPSENPDIAVIVIDNPPVNAIGQDVYEGLLSAFDLLSQETSLKAVVITAAGRTFIAGADIKLLEQAGRGEGGRLYLHPLLEKIENFSKPVIVVLHGTSLGGGMELAMSAHYRVAAPDAQMGQPEVNLGIIPGAEGTQRLPRLVGVAAAVDLCVSGKPIKAPDY
jgi:3-hydroxyacyl-CoA dehydrogenase